MTIALFCVPLHLGKIERRVMLKPGETAIFHNLQKSKETCTMKFKTLLVATGLMLSILTLNAQVQIGADIDGEAAGDESGGAVSMPDANTLAIGADGNDVGSLVSNMSDAGHVRVYTWSGTTWVQKGVDINGEGAGDWSGTSVSMPDANTLAIGAPYNGGNLIGAGHVRVYSLATLNGSENSLAALLKLYPNPASSVLNVVVASKYFNTAYSICDITGRIVLKGKLNSELTSIVLGDLSDGVYTISVGEDIRQTFKVNK